MYYTYTVFQQNDACEDVVCSKEHILASKMNCAGLSIGQSEIDIMNHSTVAMFEILEKACLAADFILLNMKHLPSCKGEGRVVVVMESLSYLEHCEKIKASCAKYCIPCELRVSSVYTGPGETLDIRSQYEGDGTLTVFITVAGRSNGLASLLSANTAYPVINCPAVTADWSAQDFRSALNTPENLGFCTVMSPEAAAQFSAHILGLSNHQLWSKLRSSTLNKWICMKQADEKLKDCSM
ncbi:bifunctional phosphoribosylaminoimidazole carboxylase/phosphoribosylaminoimidazole succinocarboxamide synthetase-like isoform X2 [Eleutherodactylus coqui]|uniref:bifunctional phosphoribosylaminoimidazole carboxylase/phosphoribosylaminoimidazole succinocarboxamide synthetase-like isoform X2 n=1 Tax=Eleutherodactylus coqui TaxID=57060 RepID=UPI0034623200